ncbi:MAG: hypothetical protein QG657_2536 [Acidobacteriota bacterium]|nr:hypothetical protein [Acidobacteriota bacterium]
MNATPTKIITLIGDTPRVAGEKCGCQFLIYCN